MKYYGFVKGKEENDHGIPFSSESAKKTVFGDIILVKTNKNSQILDLECDDGDKRQHSHDRAQIVFTVVGLPLLRQGQQLKESRKHQLWDKVWAILAQMFAENGVVLC